MSDCSVNYPAEVTAISGESILLKVLVHSACSGCHAKGHCSVADQAERVVEIPFQEGVVVGDHVTLQMAQSSGFLAVLMGYLLPLIVMVSIIFITVGFFKEEIAALLGIGGVGIYYTILWFYRDRFKKVFQIQMNE